MTEEIDEPRALALALRVAGIDYDTDDQILAMVESLHQNRWHLRFEPEAQVESRKPLFTHDHRWAQQCTICGWIFQVDS